MASRSTAPVGIVGRELVGVTTHTVALAFVH